MLPTRQKVDISAFTEAERELFQKYGKLPNHQTLIGAKLKQERKYFDSGDYALSKSSSTPSTHGNIVVGTAIPSPADIPHASPIGISGTSPTNTTTVGSAQGAGGVSMSPPGKEGGQRKDNMTFG